HDAGIPVLYGEVVVAEPELTADRVEVCLAQRVPDSLFVREVAFDGADGGIDQAGGVIALGSIDRGNVAEPLREVGHEALVPRRVHVRSPEVRAGVAAHHLLPDGRQGGAVNGGARD